MIDFIQLLVIIIVFITNDKPSTIVFITSFFLMISSSNKVIVYWLPIKSICLNMKCIKENQLSILLNLDYFI